MLPGINPMHKCSVSIHLSPKLYVSRVPVGVSGYVHSGGQFGYVLFISRSHSHVHILCSKRPRRMCSQAKIIGKVMNTFFLEVNLFFSVEYSVGISI